MLRNDRNDRLRAVMREILPESMHRGTTRIAVADIPEAALLEHVGRLALPSPAVEAEEAEVVEILAGELGRLPPRERRAIEWRYGLGGSREHTYADIAARIRVSPERARQIVARVICKLYGSRLLRKSWRGDEG